MPLMSHDRLLHELTETSEGFLRSVDSVPTDRWTYAPAQDVWSVGQTAEHTATVWRGIQRLVTGKLLEQPKSPGSPALSDEFVIQSMFDRSRRYPAPEAVLPRGRWATPAELVAAFTESRDLLIRWLPEVTVDLRAYSAPHLIMGPLDGVQWLLFAAAHTERHTRQILELRKAAGF
jgi:DinB superfamily